MGEFQEEHYWKSFERKRTSWYMAATRKSAALFREEGEKVSKLISQGKEKEAFAYLDKNKKVWETWLKKTWISIVEEVGSETYADLKSFHRYQTKADPEEEIPEDFFNPWERTIQAYIESTVADKVTNVLDTTKSKIKGLIDKLRAEDSTMDQIARAIKGKFDDFSRYRSFMIARTEIVGASNYASITSARQTGIVKKKKWVSSRDDRVRESHEDVHGESVELEEKFSNGLEFPGDYEAGKPSETIHCRCAISYTTE
jgi:uncharacterized protein with gpF-like domain